MSKYKGKCKECKHRDVVNKKWWGCTTVVYTFNSQMGKALPASENIPAWCPTGGVPEKRETTKPIGKRYEDRDLRFDELIDLSYVLSRLPPLSEKDRERIKREIENIKKKIAIRMRVSAEGEHMSEVLIKNMKLPKCCGLCPCFHAETPMYCQADKTIKMTAPYGKRMEGCPLVELPHGDLLTRGNVLFNLQVETLGIDPKDKDFEGIKKGILLARKAIAECAVVLEASI